MQHSTQLLANDTWNKLRGTVAGNPIDAWRNPVHHDTWPALEFRDDGIPVLKGPIGLPVSDRSAWFDDVGVLPSGHDLEQSLTNPKPNGGPIQ